MPIKNPKIKKSDHFQRNIETFSSTQITCLCLFILILVIPGFSQHYNFKNYSLEEGLAQSQVRSLYQAKNGYIWIGTSGGGVSKFDGITFNNFTKKDGLANNTVLAIFEDSDNNIWFGTKEGVSRYDGRTFHPLNIENRLSNSVVRAIIEDKAGNLWFGTETGAWKYDKKSFFYLTKKHGLPGDIIRALLLDHNGNLWFGTEGGGVSKYNGSRFTTFSTADGLAANEVYAILEDKKGYLWFGTVGGISSYDGKVFRNYTEENGLSHNSIKAITEDHEGNLWFGTNKGGICKLAGNYFTCFTEKNGLSSNVVWSLLTDREGNIWIGTYRGGLDKYSGDTFTYFSSKDGLADDLIRSILVDHSGNFWFGTYRGGVSRYDGNSITTFTTKHGLIDNFVLTICEDHKGNLWFGTFSGVCKYDGKRFVPLAPEQGLANHVIRSILEDHAGNIWIGTNSGGIKKYDGKKIITFTTRDGLNSNEIADLWQDREGTIWIGTLKGICHYNGKTFTDISKKFGLDQKDIYSISEDEKGSLWFGAYGNGVIKYTPPTSSKLSEKGPFEVFSRKDGFHWDTVVSLISDDRGRLWVGTEKGICQFDVELYEKTGQKKFKHYGREEGFSGIECIHNAICKDKEGNIWFGTVKGAIKYNPNRDKPNLTEPIVNITGLRLMFGEENLFDYAKGISRHGLPIGLKLPHNKNHLKFDFIGLSFTIPEKVKYQYKLEGRDNIWLSTERSYAIYSNLPHGKYTFKLKASNSEGTWNRDPTSFYFEITLPWWQTRWFYMLCFAVLMISVYLVIKMRTRYLEKRQTILEEKVTHATRELEREKGKVEQINLELENRVQERTLELVKANKSLFAEIAERKLVEEALRENEEKFRLVVQNANDAIIIVQDDVIKFPNPRTVKMLGCFSEELEKIPFSTLIHPEDKDNVLTKQKKCLERNEPFNSYSLRVINTANQELWVDLNSVPIQWEGKPATLNFFRDITEKRKLEAQLLQAKKMEAIGTMAGGIAHDFNNLLMGILGNVSLILSDIDSDYPFYSELQIIEKYVQDGANLGRQLLGFARGGKYQVTPIDLNQVIKKTSEMFARTRKEITIFGKYEENLRPVEVDQGQIEQVLLNLYVNAWQAMPGGGNLYLQTENVTFEEDDAKLYGLKPGNYDKTSVTDTGIGMDESTRQRIFDPFFTTKELGRGTGLGLAAAFGIIANHGGGIQVYSEKGKGSTFNIYLPASEKPIKEGKKLPESQLLMGKETVLLVDDEEMIFDVGKKLLERLGYKALIVKSGKEAIEIYEKNKDEIAIVILDMIMPGMGGGETFDALKEINPDIKVLLSSGYSLNGQAGEIMKRGCNGFIQKPFKLRELSKKLRSILDNSTNSNDCGRKKS
jgi:PAS domain S-box-containing protein